MKVTKCIGTKECDICGESSSEFLRVRINGYDEKVNKYEYVPKHINLCIFHYNQLATYYNNIAINKHPFDGV